MKASTKRNYGFVFYKKEGPAGFAGDDSALARQLNLVGFGV
jgi:hypothetical protein